MRSLASYWDSCAATARPRRAGTLRDRVGGGPKLGIVCPGFTQPSSVKRRPCYRALATFKRPPVRLKKQKQLRLFTHRQQQRHSLGSSRFLLLISTRCSSTAHRQIVTVLYCQKINNLLRIVSQKCLSFFLSPYVLTGKFWMSYRDAAPNGVSRLGQMEFERR